MRKFVLGVLLSVVSLYAQGTTSRVLGTVLDASGATVANAQVDLTNQGTQATFHTVTDSAGNYVFDSVQVGQYTLAVASSGFKKYQSTGNAVTIGQPATINVTLEVGSSTQSVEVSGTAEQVQTSTSGNLGNLLTGRSIRELPIVGTRGRNPLDLVLIQPGVVNGSNTGGGIHVNGARDRSWNFTVDGIDSNETSAGGSNFSPVRLNPDALSEYRAITSNATADYGRNSGGQVSLITSSGTNEFHGTGFWFYRTPRLNAADYNNLINGVGKPQFVQHIYGGSLGGPIVRNKLFFFTNVQALAAKNSFQITRTVYTATARQGLLRYVNGGRNRPSGVSGASVDAAGNPLPGLNIGSYNVITNDPQRAGLDAVTQGLIAQAPLPNNFAVGDGLNTAGFNFAPSQQERQHDETFKVDFILNPQNTFFFRGSWGSQDTNCDNANGGLPVFPGTGCLVNTVREPRSFAANWRWNPSARVTNELVVGQNHFAFLFQQPTADLNRITILTPGSSIYTPVDNTAQYDFSNVRTLNTNQIVDNLSYTTGAHTIKVGTNLRYQREDDLRGSVGGRNSTTEVDFSTGTNPVDTRSFGLPAGLNTAFDLPAFQSNINFLLGRVGTATRGFVAQDGQFATGQLPFQSKWPEFDFYGQDTWKVRRNLTIDAGLRWEIKMAPGSTTNTITRPDQAVAIGAPPNNNLTWVPGQLYNNSWRNFGPSVGFAWDPFSSGKTSIRANYRIAYDRLNTFSLSSAVFANLPGSVTSTSNQSYGIAGGRFAGLSPLAPPALAPGQLLTPPTYSANTITTVDPNVKMPTTHEWSFSVQRQISAKTIVEVDYIGRRAYHLFGGYNINQADITNNGFVDAFNTVKAGGDSPLINSLTSADSRRNTGETGSQMVRRLFSTQLSNNSVAGLAGSLASRIQGTPERSVVALSGQDPNFFIPYNQFNGGFNVLDSNDFSTYHALQVQLQRRLAAGLEGQVSYSLSKSLDTRSFDPTFTIVSTGSGQSAANTPLDIYNRRANYALSDFDRRHVIQSYFVYEVPFGKGQRFFPNANAFIQRLVGGWQVSGFLTWESGRPFTAYSGSNTFSNVRQTAANCSGCSRPDGELFIDPASSFYAYFDDAEKAKFSIPTAGSFSNTGRNFFRGPGFFDLDATFAKNIYFTGDTRYRLQIRADVVNLTNHPNFGFPTAIFTSSTFGRIRDTMDGNYQPRKVQLGLKFFF